MPLSTTVSSLLEALDTFSQHKLTRQNDLGILIELASQSDAWAMLDELAFTAKFVTRTQGIMGRIGKEGTGYDGLEQQFREQLGKATAIAQKLLEKAPKAVEHRFALEYFVLSQDALHNLLALFHDLSWYKNWQLDHPSQH